MAKKIKDDIRIDIANILNEARKEFEERSSYDSYGWKTYAKYHDKLLDLLLEVDSNYFYPQYNPYILDE